MFNKLKQFKDLRSQAKTMQDVLKDEMVESEKDGVKIVMNGNMKVESVTVKNGIPKDKIERAVADCIDDVIKKAQKTMAKQMQEMGGFPGLN